MSLTGIFLKPHVFIGIRYSMIERFNDKVGRPAFKKLGIKSEDEYINFLLDDNRLSKRLYLFNRFTIPSILNMHNESSDMGIGFTVVLATTDLLPDTHLDALHKACSASNAIKIVTPKNGIKDALLNEITKIPAGTVHATVRLDDDDALSPTYISTLSAYLAKPYLNHAISFPSGYYAYVENNGDVSMVASVKKPKIALGLALIEESGSPSKTIYGLGNHQRIDDHTPLLMDSRKKMFIRVAHRDSDTYSQPGSFEKDMDIHSRDVALWEDVKKEFRI